MGSPGEGRLLDIHSRDPLAVVRWWGFPVGPMKVVP
jgi:hypothetical protein